MSVITIFQVPLQLTPGGRFQACTSQQWRPPAGGRWQPQPLSVSQSQQPQSFSCSQRSPALFHLYLWQAEKVRGPCECCVNWQILSEILSVMKNFVFELMKGEKHFCTHHSYEHTVVFVCCVAFFQVFIFFVVLISLLWLEYKWFKNGCWENLKR